MKKLIIWDFDGVIADTENLLVKLKMDTVNQNLNLNWDFETTKKYLGGISDKDKKRVLEKLGIFVEDNFWQSITQNCNMNKLLMNAKITEGIENIFNLKEFDQCIATGGTSKVTDIKIKKAGIDNYFNSSNTFTIDLVEYGKPAPDLFELSCFTMGYTPENTFVIEDSVAGITAAIKAKMTPIAFVKYNDKDCIEEIKKLGIKNIFDNMQDIKEFLLENLN